MEKQNSGSHKDAPVDPCTWSPDTQAARGPVLYEPLTGAVSTPIYQSATFRHPGLEESSGYDYSRSQNPTRKVLEDTIALLEHGRYGLAFATGMGAISALMKMYSPGGHFVVSEDLYGGPYRLFNDYYKTYGFSFSWVDTSDGEKVGAAMRPETKAVFIETPSNPMMKVTDISLCAEIIHAHGGDLIVDNTFLSPYFQNPLDFGADFVVHSGTKYLGGHNDTLAGFIVHDREDQAAVLTKAQMSEGATLAPFDAWLLIRGIKTLALRMRRHEESAARIAQYLCGHPLVDKVFYPGLPDHPQYKLSCFQTRGSGGMVSFYLKNKSHAPRLLKNISLILFAESLGGVESLMTYPIVQTHQAIPQEMLKSSGVNDRLMRLSVGIEAPDDLIADLEQALALCAKGGE
jgi:cystathionine gamma-synthase